MFCEKCGNELPDGVRYCNKCGTPVSNIQTEAGQGTAGRGGNEGYSGEGRRGKGGGVPAVVWVLLAVGIGAGAAAFGKSMLSGGGGRKENGVSVVYETQQSGADSENRQPGADSGKKETGTSRDDNSGGRAGSSGADKPAQPGGESGTAAGNRAGDSGAAVGNGAGDSSKAGGNGVGDSGAAAGSEAVDGGAGAGSGTVNSGAGAGSGAVNSGGAAGNRAGDSGAAETDAPHTESESAPESSLAVQPDSQFVLPGSDSRYIDARELENFTEEQCRLARNEIYARHGRRFNDEGLQAYFDSRDWYTGTVAPENFRESVLNEYELYNRDLIVKYEEQHGYR